jgi:dTDP-glucose pyrophosphorylase
LIGLPDTVWFPQDGLSKLPDESLSFLLFPVDHPELFDAVLVDSTGVVTKILVKHPDPGTFWIWGAIKMTGAIFHKLHALWLTRSKKDEFLGTLVNAYLDSGGKARALRYGISYVDVGTLHGYREAIKLLSEKRLEDGSGIHTSREFEIRLA